MYECEMSFVYFARFEWSELINGVVVVVVIVCFVCLVSLRSAAADHDHR